jgi:hypothetical protein
MEQHVGEDFDAVAAGRAASAGGARAASGVSNQARVVAWVGAHMLAGIPLPSPFAPNVINAVGAETALAVDDVGAVADDGSVLLIQGKGGLQLRRDPSSDLASGLGQVVRQFHNGVPTPGGTRAIDPDRDVLAIVGDRGSSQQIRRLARVCTRLRTLPEGVPIETAVRTNDEASALSCVLDHLRREWTSVCGSALDDADLRAVLRCLIVDVLDLVAGEAITEAKAALRGVLPVPSDDEAAWSDLVTVGMTLAAEQRWLSRSDLVSQLSVDVGPDRRLAADIRRLREASEANIEILSEHAHLPIGQREPVAHRPEVAELIAATGSFVLTGDPGCGKTGAVAALAEEISRRQDLLVLAVDGLGGSAGATRLELGLSHDLEEVIKGWTGRGTGTLVLDGIDAARGEATAWLRRLCLSLNGTRWRVIASVRQFELRHSSEWQRVFVGDPIASDTMRVDPELTGVRHYLLGPFSDADLAQLASQSADVAGLLSDAQPALLDLLRVPFNLRIACELVESGESPASLAMLRDQVGLLDRYWRARVTDATDGIDRRRVLAGACRAMLARRRLRIDVGALDDAPGPAVHALLRDGVLVETRGLLRTGGIGPLGFSHQILFDFAVAVLVLQEAGTSLLVPALDEDPNLALVARPSIDFHLVELWHADLARSAFASVAARLADSDHVLAGAAAGRACAAEACVEADIGWLVDRVDGASGRARVSTLVGWICGALDAADEAVAAHVRACLIAWAKVARRLAALLEANFDEGLAQQVFRLLWQLNALRPLALVTANDGDGNRAAAAAALMTAALAEPADRGWLAQRVAMLLPGAVAVDPSHAAVLRATLGPSVMGVWRPEVYRQYVDGIEQLVAGDADVAAEVLVAVWRFEPTSDEITPMSTGVLSLTSTVRQDADHVKWLTGEKFAAFSATAGPRRAALVMGAALESRRAADVGYAPNYPVMFGSVSGSVDRLADDLRHGAGMGAAGKIVDAFVELVARVPVAELSDILAAVTAEVPHPDVWRLLLEAGASHPDTLGRALLPALRSGGLFAHTDTRSAAAKLAAALCGTVDDVTYADIEAAVLAGAALLTESPAAADRLLDQLVGILPAARIADPSLATRRASLDAAGDFPTIPEPQGFEAHSVPITLEDLLGKEQVEMLDVDERSMVDELRSTLSAARDSAEPDAIECLQEALKRMLGEPHRAPARDHPAYGLVVSACVTLARRMATPPDTDLGDTVAEVLLDAAGLDPEDAT